MQDAQGNVKAAVNRSFAASTFALRGKFPPTEAEVNELKGKTIFARPSLELLTNHVGALPAAKAFNITFQDHQAFKDRLTTLSEERQALREITEFANRRCDINRRVSKYLVDEARRARFIAAARLFDIENVMTGFR